jgi:hypothetical protein
MADIQNVVVTSTQTVTQPKPHTTYTIQSETYILTSGGATLTYQSRPPSALGQSVDGTMTL